jgi:hypothetical protein
MQQRQLRLGDILDDYCPRERRLTNHAVVAMVGEDVKRTRCTTCDTEHEYKHAKVPHQRRKVDTPAALYTQVLANGPKKIPHDAEAVPGEDAADALEASASFEDGEQAEHVENAENRGNPADVESPEHSENPENIEHADPGAVEGPVHRRLIRATLPRLDGVPPPQRPIPEFTIRQPAGRPHNRFRARQGRGGGGGQSFQGGGNGRMNGGRPQGPGRSRQGGHGRKRSK